MATKTKKAKKADGSPEAHNDPARTEGADEQRRIEQIKEIEGRAEVNVSGGLTTGMEIVIDFTGLAPETDFECKIAGPTAQNYWATLKSDPWGQAQLIWRTPYGGKYTVTGKGGTGDRSINVSGDFEVTAYDPDEEYRAEKRKGRKKNQFGSLQSVEEPGVMGDKSSAEQRADPSKRAEDPLINDPAFKTAEHDPKDQGDPAINKEPHPEGSAQFNYRVPGEPETIGSESKETVDGDEKEASKKAEAETKKAKKVREAAAPDDTEVSPNKGQSDPKTQLEIDRENAQTGADEADR